MSKRRHWLACLLTQYREDAWMTQGLAAERSGIGVKTISSYETGERIESIGALELFTLLMVYGKTLPQFAADAEGRESE